MRKKAAKEPKKAPTKYLTKEKKFDLIIQEIEEGLSVRKAIKKHRIGNSIFFDIIRNNPESRERYARATETRSEILFDEMIEIADDGTNDYTTKIIGGEEVEVLNAEHVQRSKLRIDARKWILAKMNPKKYGDKIDANLNHSGEVEIKQSLIIGGKEIQF